MGVDTNSLAFYGYKLHCSNEELMEAMKEFTGVEDKDEFYDSMLDRNDFFGKGISVWTDMYSGNWICIGVKLGYCSEYSGSDDKTMTAGEMIKAIETFDAAREKWPKAFKDLVAEDEDPEERFHFMLYYS